MKQREFTEAEVDAVIERLERVTAKMKRDVVDHRIMTTPLTEDHEVTASNERSNVRTFTESEIDAIVSRFERMEQDLIRTARLNKEDRRDERNRQKAPERNIEPVSSTNKALRTRLQELTKQSIEGRKQTT